MKRPRPNTQDLADALPELERELDDAIGQAWASAVRKVKQERRTRDGASIAADPRRQYSRNGGRK